MQCTQLLLLLNNVVCFRLLYKDNFAQLMFQVCLLSGQIAPLLTLLSDNQGENSLEGNNFMNIFSSWPDHLLPDSVPAPLPAPGLLDIPPAGVHHHLHHHETRLLPPHQLLSPAPADWSPALLSLLSAPGQHWSVVTVLAQSQLSPVLCSTGHPGISVSHHTHHQLLVNTWPQCWGSHHQSWHSGHHPGQCDADHGRSEQCQCSGSTVSIIFRVSSMDHCQLSRGQTSTHC